MSAIWKSLFPELDNLETRLETFIEAEQEVNHQLQQQEMKFHDSETEKRELQQQVKVLKEALNERQVATVTTIEGDLAQLLKSVEKNQVYIGYPNFDMDSVFESFCRAICQMRSSVKYHSDMFAFIKNTMPDGFIKKIHEHYKVGFWLVFKL